ncbi:proline racemase family protein [Bartonella apis]|uniref:proline racemase family protein n=1 Tax=Bartonella apis TaxID=1686310 RepID=UPI00242F4045|nr:proline racemase family protein [Bartonella apis]
MTGCLAKMAVLYAHGEMKVGNKLVGTSIIAAEFHCRIDRVGEINAKPTIDPIISGRNWGIGT